MSDLTCTHFSFNFGFSKFNPYTSMLKMLMVEFVSASFIKYAFKSGFSVLFVESISAVMSKPTTFARNSNV